MPYAVLVDQAAQYIAPSDLASAHAVGRRTVSAWCQKVESAMGPRLVVLAHVGAEAPAGGGLARARAPSPSTRLLLSRPTGPKSVGVRGLDRGSDHARALGGEHLVEGHGDLRVTVVHAELPEGCIYSDRRPHQRFPPSRLVWGEGAWVSVCPDNVHETGVSPGGRSGSPHRGCRGGGGRATRRKTWSRIRSEVCHTG
jgi:hypothetical protein